jgi:hypothetical protein
VRVVFIHSGENTTSESNERISAAFLLSFNLNATIIILLRALHKNHGTHDLSLDADPNRSGLSFELQCAEPENSNNVKERQP